MATAATGRLHLAASLRYHRTSQGAAAIRRDIVLINRKLGLMESEFRKINRSLRRTLRGFGGLALAFGAFQAVRGVARFGQDIATLQAVTQATEKDIRMLERRIRDLAATTRFTGTQAAEAATALGRAGFTATEVWESVGGALDLALVGQLEVADATRITADVLRAFGLEAREMTQVVDALSAGAVNANMTIQDIGLAMSHAAPFFKKFGADLKTGVALLGTLANAGIRGERAGTALRQTMIKIADLTPKAQNAIESLNFGGRRLTPADLDVGRLGIMQVLENLSKVGLGTSAELEKASQQLQGVGVAAHSADRGLEKVVRGAGAVPDVFNLADESISRTTRSARILGTIFEARAGAAMALLLARFMALKEQIDFVGDAVESNGAFFSRLAATMRNTLETAALRVLSVWQELMLAIFRGQTGDSPVISALKVALHLLADAIQWTSQNLWVLQAAFAAFFASAGVPIINRIAQGMWTLATATYTTAGAVTAAGIAFRALMVATGVFLVIQALSLVLAVASGETAGLAGWVRKLGGWLAGLWQQVKAGVSVYAAFGLNFDAMKRAMKSWWKSMTGLGASLRRAFIDIIVALRPVLIHLGRLGAWLTKYILAPAITVVFWGIVKAVEGFAWIIEKIAQGIDWVARGIRKAARAVRDSKAGAALRDSVGLNWQLASALSAVNLAVAHWKVGPAAPDQFSSKSIEAGIAELERLRRRALWLGADDSALAQVDALLVELADKLGKVTAAAQKSAKAVADVSTELQQFGEVNFKELDRLVNGILGDTVNAEISKLDELFGHYDELQTVLARVASGYYKVGVNMEQSQKAALDLRAVLLPEAIDKQFKNLVDSAAVSYLGDAERQFQSARLQFQSLVATHERLVDWSQEKLELLVKSGATGEEIEKATATYEHWIDLLQGAMNLLVKKTRDLESTLVRDQAREIISASGFESPGMEIFDRGASYVKLEKQIAEFQKRNSELIEWSESAVRPSSGEAAIDDFDRKMRQAADAVHLEPILDTLALKLRKQLSMDLFIAPEGMQSLDAMLQGTGIGVNQLPSVRRSQLGMALHGEDGKSGLAGTLSSMESATGQDAPNADVLQAHRDAVAALREEYERLGEATMGVGAALKQAFSTQFFKVVKGAVDSMASGIGQWAVGAQSFRQAAAGAVSAMLSGMVAMIAKVLTFIGLAAATASIGLFFGTEGFSTIFTGIFKLLLGTGSYDGFGSGFATAIGGFATGGWVAGPGTATSDNLMALLSPGEFVVSAPAAARAGPVLEDINAGRLSAAAGGVEQWGGRSTGNIGLDDDGGAAREVVVPVTVNLDGRKMAAALARAGLDSHGRGTLPRKRTSTA